MSPCLRVTVLALASLFIPLVALAEDAAPPAASRPAVDPPEVVGAYEDAFFAFAHREYATAAGKFDYVAARSVEPARQLVAAELARRARALAGAAALATAARKASGPRSFVVANWTAMGLAFYSWGLPVALDINDEKTSVGVGMLSAGASFAVPFLLSRGEELSWGAANLGLYGTTLGVVHGILAADAFGNQPGERAIAGTAIALSLVEGIGGDLLALRLGIDEGVAHQIGTGGLFGLGWGLGLGMMLDLHGDRSLEAMALGGSVVGYAVGAADGYGRERSWGQAEVIQGAGVLGAYLAAVPFIWTEPSGDLGKRIAAGTIVTGSIAGLVVGEVITRGKDFSVGESLLVDLGSVAGFAFGSGITYLLLPRDTEDIHKPIVTVGAVGATAGFATLYTILGDDVGRTRIRKAAAPAILPFAGPRGEPGVALVGQF